MSGVSHAPRASLGGARRLLLAAPVALLLLFSPVSPFVTIQADEPGHPSASGSSGPSTPLSASGDWPTYLQNPTRTSANLAETFLSPSNAKQLKQLWAVKTGGPIAASATVVGNTVYVGSWDGFEYALNATNGHRLWRTSLGPTTKCSAQGVTASATVVQNTLYVGGGQYWYALNTSTGNVSWKVSMDTAPGFYDYSSPLIYNNSGYIGLSSNCDKPLVPGGLIRVNLATHMIDGWTNTTSNGQLGASVWGSPSVNPATNTIYFTTGNSGPKTTNEVGESVVAVNATSMKIVGSWKVPTAQEISDGDFGTTPTLFTNASGVPMVAAMNKNGILYAWDQSSLSAGPVWQFKITHGQAVASGAYANGLVFQGGGTATIGPDTVSGSVWALNATTGKKVWDQPLWGKDLAAPAYANGLLVVDGGTHVFVLNAATGAKIAHFGCGALFFAPPVISHGRIYVGCSDGHEYAFGIPGTAPTVVGRFPASPPAATTTASGVPMIALRLPGSGRLHDRTIWPPEHSRPFATGGTVRS